MKLYPLRWTYQLTAERFPPIVDLPQKINASLRIPVKTVSFRCKNLQSKKWIRAFQASQTVFSHMH